MNKSSDRGMVALLLEREGEKVQLTVGDGMPVALQLKEKPLGTMTVSCVSFAGLIEGRSGRSKNIKMNKNIISPQTIYMYYTGAREGVYE